MKSLSPIFYHRTCWFSVDMLYECIHYEKGDSDYPSWKVEFHNKLKECLGNREKLKADRLMLKLIAQEVKNKKEDLIGGLGFDSLKLKDRFTIAHAQVLFDGQDLNVGAGAATEILQKLVKNFGRVVTFKELDENSSQKEASEKIRTAKGRINKILKSGGVPSFIDNRKGDGYIMLPLNK